MKDQQQKHNDEEILEALEAVAEKLAVRVHYEDMKAFEFRIQDGLCTLRGEPHIYIDRKRPTRERIHILASELKKFNLETVYIPPLLRERVFEPTSPGGSGSETP